MIRRLLILAISMVALGIGIAAAQPADARLRVTQLSYLEMDDGSYALAADIFFDDELFFADVSFPFTTDFVNVPAGSHTIRTAVTGQNDVSAITGLELTAGHDYSLVVFGDYVTGGVKFVLVDHAGLPLQETGSAAILVNYYPEGVDVYFDDARVIEDIAQHGHEFVGVPIGDFTVSVTTAGQAENVLYTSDGSGLPNTIYLGISWGSTPQDFQNIQHLSSDLNAADYLAALGGEDEFGGMRNLFESAGLFETLSGVGPFTLFLPVNDVLDEAEQDVVPEAGYYVVAQHLPPYTLPGHDTLETLSGGTVALDFGDTESGYWEINGAPIVWDMRVANGVIYAVEGLMLPSQ